MDKMTRLILVILFLSGPFISKGQNNCGRNQLIVAQSLYDKEMISECLNGLKPCIENGGFMYSERLEALVLCAKCYLAVDSLQMAYSYIEQILETDVNYWPSPGDHLDFRLSVAYVREQLKSNSTSSVSKKTGKIELAPATIQVITTKDIEDRGYTDLESVFYDLPGFDISRTYGLSYSVLYQRGSRSPSLTERTMILIDGVEDNDIWTNAAYITKQYPLSNIKRIEVIYGPVSTIYGANAFSGVINIVTKEESDVITRGIDGKPVKAAVNMQTGVASNNTQFVDGTVYIPGSRVFATITGRAYFSDGVDLSSEPYWDGIPTYDSATYMKRMAMPYKADSIGRYIPGGYFEVNADSTKIIPTAAGIHRADSLNRALYKTASKNAGSYFNPIRDFYIAGKLSLGHFNFGFQYWNKNEGAAGDYTDNFASVNSAFTNWQVRGLSIHAQYDSKLSDRVTVSSLTYYRHYDYGDNSRVSNFNSIGTSINNYKFITGVLPYFSRTYYYQASNEFRTELKSNYDITDRFSVLGGLEFTTGMIQTNYLTSTLEPAVIYGRVVDSPGGNQFTTYTMSGYLTASYHNPKLKLNIDAGGRIDNNQFRERYGYKTERSPRADVIWYPGKMVFKLIYTEAFLNVSAQNKFSTTSARLLNNPGLKAEKVSNVEISARLKFKKQGYIEIAAYRSDYSNAIGTETILLYYIGASPYTTTQYRNIGKALVLGLQIASEWSITRHLSVYANLTHSNSHTIFKSSTGSDSTVRTGDIASVSGNLGINFILLNNKLNLNARVNYIGDKPTGSGTSVPTNPYTRIEGITLLNATLGYRVIKGILIQVGCNNIADSKYYSPGVRTADGSTYSSRVLQPGRNYMARVIFDLKK